MKPAPLLVTIFAVAFGVLHVSTLERFPPAWVDEVMYTDASINVVLGNGFTSTAWPSQPGDAFWAGNTPLHEWLLIPWIKAFGFTPTGVRSINVLFVVAAVIAIVVACRRIGWLQSPFALGAFLLLMGVSLGMAAVAREGRPDGIKTLVAAIGFLAFTVPPPRRRIALFVAGLLVIPAGFQVAMFGFVCCVVAWIWIGRSYFRDGFALGLGIVIGFVLLMGLYAAKGQARSFIENTVASGHTLTGDLAQTAVIGDAKVKKRLGNRLDDTRKLVKIFTIDPAHPILLGFGAVAAFGLSMSKRLNGWRDPIVAGLVASLAAPVVSTLTGKYFLHYTWIGTLPLLLTVALIVDRLANRYAAAFVTISLAVLGSLFGFPTELATKGNDAEVEFVRIREFVADTVQPTDHVYAADAFYYAAKPRAKGFISTGYAGGRGYKEMTDAERNAITVMIVNVDGADAFKAKIGGLWEEVRTIALDAKPFDNPESGGIAYTAYRRK
jgi:hypothetical protein